MFYLPCTSLTATGGKSNVGLMVTVISLACPVVLGLMVTGILKSPEPYILAITHHVLAGIVTHQPFVPPETTIFAVPPAAEKSVVLFSITAANADGSGFTGNDSRLQASRQKSKRKMILLSCIFDVDNEIISE